VRLLTVQVEVFFSDNGSSYGPYLALRAAIGSRISRSRKQLLAAKQRQGGTSHGNVFVVGPYETNTS
jgi:hypothetical protein